MNKFIDIEKSVQKDIQTYDKFNLTLKCLTGVNLRRFIPT